MSDINRNIPHYEKVSPGGQRQTERRRRKGKKRWEDNIRKLTSLEFAKSQRAVENREKWRKLVVKSSVVPQRPPRFWDR